MLYHLFYYPARIALYFYCRQLQINKREFTKLSGPLILAANHPNSFLDAIIIASIFKHPVYSLARGDAFVSPWIIMILRSLKMLPVYRISEGKENLKNNFNTFDSVNELLQKDKIVLIFSEGLCINEWHLRPLKKGTARMAIRAWESNIPLKVLPVGINYSSFRHFGKKMIINFGDIITQENFNNENDGKNIIAFNQRLNEQLSSLIYEIPAGDIEKRRKIFEIQKPEFHKTLLFIPAMAGYLLHAPFYLAVHYFIRKKASVHYDGIIVGIIFLLYPWLILLALYILYSSFGLGWILLMVLILPASALALIHYRNVVE